MNKISEQIKVDIGLIGQTINNSNVIGKYHPMTDFRKAIAVLMAGALAATKTCKIEIFEGEDKDGTSGAVLTGAEATITANTNITEGTVDLTSAASTDVVTINGVEYTMGASTIVASREFVDDDGLAECVNDSTYGVSGVSATASADIVTLLATEPGETVITVSKTENSGTIALATTKAQAYVEIDNMDMSGDNTHIACKVTSTGNGICSVLLIRDSCRKAVSQKVGASKVL